MLLPLARLSPAHDGGDIDKTKAREQIEGNHKDPVYRDVIECIEHLNVLAKENQDESDYKLCQIDRHHSYNKGDAENLPLAESGGILIMQTIRTRSHCGRLNLLSINVEV